MNDSTDGSAPRPPDTKASTDKNTYADPRHSARGGVGGMLEVAMRRFKSLMHGTLVIPIYGVACLVIGCAVAPGFAMYDFIASFAEGQGAWLRYFVHGFGAAAGYFTYGFALLFIIPLANFIVRGRLHPWRGAYYSLEAIRWYIHNGLTYLARFTFLEFVTPTPFNLMFYRLMGMKIGRGVAINSTWISDPSLIEIGDKVTIGGSVTLIAHYGQGGYLVLAKTKIGDRVTIGLKATIMGGVTIGENAKIVPNSVVMPKTVIPAGEVWGGVPARKLEL